ncbi:hypothetical protein AB0B66_10475 [Catellatospora sp. NPDC049111]|uniref:hypothetical protein n=1 Tax=Catellatospora sp. NPDC049111 TaxID=3155271 RepID=UPI0033F41483
MTQTPDAGSPSHPHPPSDAGNTAQLTMGSPIVPDSPEDLILMFELDRIQQLVYEASASGELCLMLVVGHGIQLHVPNGSAVWAHGWQPAVSLHAHAAQLQRRRASHLGDDQQHELPLDLDRPDGLYAVVTTGVAGGDTALKVTVSAEAISITTDRPAVSRHVGSPPTAGRHTGSAIDSGTR